MKMFPFGDVIVNSYILRHGQNGHHFAEDISKNIFVNGRSYLVIQISLKFLPRGPGCFNSARGVIMAWRSLNCHDDVIKWNHFSANKDQ